MNVGGVGRKFECPIGLTVDAHRTCLVPMAFPPIPRPLKASEVARGGLTAQRLSSGSKALNQ